jgi:ribose transport system ATP-binding protein
MKPIVEIRGLVKQFPGQTALDRVDLALMAGEIHGLVGENGSGKSTLIKCLAGYYASDGGTISIGGEPIETHGVPLAYARGLRFIHQDPAVFGSLTVAENLAIGGGFRCSGRWSIRWRPEREAAAEALATLGVEIDLTTRLADLTPARRTMVAVARALQPDPHGRGARLLVLDEPTAALPEHEVESLFAVVRAAAARGVAILYVSHRIEEIFALTDRVTVLRDGKRVATTATAELTEAALVSQIIGQHTGLQVGTRPPMDGAAPVRLEVRGLASGRLDGVDFSVRRGEVLGIAGLLGSGRSRIARVLFGAERADAGTILVDGDPVELRNPSDAIAVGMALVPEDRRAQSSFGGMSVAANLTVGDVAPYVRLGSVSPRLERRDVLRLIEDHDVRPRDADKTFALLSGGNQQKVVLARWIRLAPKVMLLDEPTQGIDIQAKEEILKLVDQLSAQGVATVFISSDHTEYRRICDRVLVLRAGQVAGELTGDEIDPRRIAELAFMDVAA